MAGTAPRRWPPPSRRTCWPARRLPRRAAVAWPTRPSASRPGSGWPTTIDRPSASPLVGSPAATGRAPPSRPPPWCRPRWPRSCWSGWSRSIAAMAAGDAGLVALLILAPLAPMAAVALAYRDWADPAGEISLATAVGRAAPGGAARPGRLAGGAAAGLRCRCSPSTPGSNVPMSAAVAWCLPGLALAALVLLAGTTRLDPLQVAVGLSVGWAVSVGAVVTRPPQPAPRALHRPHRRPGGPERGPRRRLAAVAAHRRPPRRRRLPEDRMTTHHHPTAA